VQGDDGPRVARGGRGARPSGWGRPDPNAEYDWRGPGWRRGLELSLGTLWLLDGILQLQPFFFSAGAKGFSGSLIEAASGNPRWILSTIVWNARIVDRHPVLTNSAFAAIQIMIGLGIACGRKLRFTLAVSIVWCFGVWWFGEGLGGVTAGAGTPADGGPGRAKALWAVTWMLLAGLSVFGAARSSTGVDDLVRRVETGEPGWLASLDNATSAAVDHKGLTFAIVLATICSLIAVSVHASGPSRRAGAALAVGLAASIWVLTQNFGMILAGNATDPNSGPLLALLALAYWPPRPSRFDRKRSGATLVAAERV
jgi:hypothetical protein